MIIQFSHTFDAGHRIVGHKGKCARLHGHTYKVEMTVTGGELVDPGFVVDFGDLKELIDEWDHRMLLWDQDTTRVLRPEMARTSIDDLMGVVRVPFNPTAENMVQYLVREALNRFSNVLKVNARLWETPKGSAYYEAVRQSASE